MSSSEQCCHERRVSIKSHDGLREGWRVIVILITHTHSILLDGRAIEVHAVHNPAIIPKLWVAVVEVVGRIGVGAINVKSRLGCGRSADIEEPTTKSQTSGRGDIGGNIIIAEPIASRVEDPRIVVKAMRQSAKLFPNCESMSHPGKKEMFCGGVPSAAAIPRIEKPFERRTFVTGTASAARLEHI